MEQERIGKFICECRKNKNMTQEELASLLNITKNAVSKWERGLSLPDVSIMQELCKLLGISLNELFAGEKIKNKNNQEQFEKNILNILNFNNNKNKKYKLISLLSLIVIVFLVIFFSRTILIKKGFIMDSNLQYTQSYISGYNNIKGDVDIIEYQKRSVDFDIGANKYGYAVFKNPKKALKRLKSDYKKGIALISREYHLLPLTSFNYKSYMTYGWQVNTGTKEEQEEAHFVTRFLDIYDNSFN